MMATPAQPSDRNDVEKGAAQTAAAFGAAAAITVLFNVVLAFVKDAYAPLNTLMAHLTGHHWVTHGLADILVFVALGWLFAARGIPARGLTISLVVALGAAVLVAGAALGGWFILF
jgi:hypothetical protein